MRTLLTVFILLSSALIAGTCGFNRGTPFDGGSQPGVRIWGDSDYLYWWTKNAPLPVPIATSGSSSDAAPAAIGQPGTKVLFGDQSINNGPLSGFRVSIRGWIDSMNRYALETSGFYLPEKTITAFSKRDSDVLGVPFNNDAPFPLPADSGGWVTPGAGETALLIGYDPLSFNGTIRARSSTELWGVELNGLFHFYCRPASRLSALAGASYTDLLESLQINYQTFTGSAFLAAKIQDRFKTHNELFAGQIGLRGEWSNGWWFTSFVTKLGRAAVRQIAHISGSFSDPKPYLYNSYGVGNSGGIFAQPTNSGKHTQTRFAAIPSLTLKFGLNLITNLRLSFGYDVLFLTNVLRPGDQIDSTINETQVGSSSGTTPLLTGPARPKSLMETTYYWSQGINAGIEARF